MNAEIQVVITELEAARLAQLQRLMVCDIATSASEIRSLADLRRGFGSRQSDFGGS
jgi:hypothetical protein